MNDYKFELGSICNYKGFKRNRLFIIERHHTECHAGTQNYYKCRLLIPAKDDKTYLSGISPELFSLCEIELEKGGD